MISGNAVYDDNDNDTLLYVDTEIDNSLNLWAPSSYTDFTQKIQKDKKKSSSKMKYIYL